MSGLVPVHRGSESGAAYPSSILHDPILYAPRVTSTPVYPTRSFRPYVYGQSDMRLRPVLIDAGYSGRAR